MSRRDDDATGAWNGDGEGTDSPGARGDEATDAPIIGDDEARGIDASVRALRDEPVAADRLARMRAGLDARIADLEAGDRGAGDAPVVPIESHPRWRGREGAVAAALAAAVLLALLVTRTDEPPAGRAPVEVAEDVHRATIDEPRLAPEPVERVVADRAAPEPVEQVVVDHAAPEASALAADLESASDEDLAMAIEYERLADYDVIAQLELLELLDEMGEGGRI